MNVKRLNTRSLFAALSCTVVCSSLLAAPSKSNTDTLPEAVRQSFGRLDRSWKRYHNPELGYCVSYPAHWTRDGAFEGTGLVVQTGQQRYSRPTGEIDMGLLALPVAEDARLAPARLSRISPEESLLQDLKEHLEGLQKFARAERLQTIDQHTMRMQGNSALFVKNRYYDPLERADWTEEVVFVKRQGELFRLELQCRSDQLKRFEPIFSYVLNTFQFDCK